jgi:Ca-activated chloride channel family protein
MNLDEFLKLKVNLRTGGATALFDAVSLACKKSMRVDPAWPARRVLVILSDGGDNFSHITHDEAIAAAQSAGTVVFAISTSQNSGNDLDGKRLEQFGDKTGGHVFLHLSRADVAKDFSRIKDWIGHLYTITYIPVEQGENGKRRSVELRARGNRLKVHAPTAYFVPGGAE